jgi:peptidoglycan hydrolase-like protein with peptidoglycan-binding domain
MSVGDTVGNGFENEPRDVETVKRALGGLGYLPEDPFDRPSGFIEESTTKAVRRFQDDNRLTADGWLGPKGETEAALQQAVDRLARVKRPEWLEYHRRAPSPEALKGIGILDNPAEAARLAAQLFKNAPAASRGSLLDLGEPGSRSNDADPTSPNAPEPVPKLSRAPANEGIGSTSVDPEGNFGSWAIKRSDVLPEGVEPPADPLKPDPLPRECRTRCRATTPTDAWSRSTPASAASARFGG